MAKLCFERNLALNMLIYPVTERVDLSRNDTRITRNWMNHVGARIDDSYDKLLQAKVQE